MNLLEFIEWMVDTKPSKIKLEPKITVLRSNKSRYMFSLAGRILSQQMGVKPSYYVFDKSRGYVDSVKGIVEEFSFFDGDSRLFILEGFYNKWVKALTPAPGTIILAETDGGDLDLPQFNRLNRRILLKALVFNLELMSISPRITLSELKTLDWSHATDYGDFEPYLLKAKLLGKGVAGIKEDLDSFEGGNLMVAIKKGQAKPLLELSEKYDSMWVYTKIMRDLSQVVHVKSLQMMGVSDDKITRDLGYEAWSRHFKNILEAATMYTMNDLRSLSERVVRMEMLVKKSPEIGVSLLAFNVLFKIAK